MKDLKPFNIQPISKDLDDLFKESSGIDPEIDLEKILELNFTKNNELLSSKMKDYMLVFDEGVKSLIRIHELCKQNQADNKTGFSFTVLSIKVLTLAIGIRQMLHSGFVDSAKNLYRPFIETIDVLYACLVNPELNNAFGNVKKLYDSNDFYWKNFSKNKLKKDHQNLFKKIKITENYIDYLTERRKHQRSFLSESIHVSFSSSMANFLMSTIDWQMSDSYFGKITTAHPKLFMELIEEIYLYNTIFFKALELKLCVDFEGVKIDPLTTHYHKKFESIYTMYSQSLFQKVEDFTKVFEHINEKQKNNNA